MNLPTMPPMAPAATVAQTAPAGSAGGSDPGRCAAGGASHGVTSRREPPAKRADPLRSNRERRPCIRR